MRNEKLQKNSHIVLNWNTFVFSVKAKKHNAITITHTSTINNESNTLPNF